MAGAKLGELIGRPELCRQSLETGVKFRPTAACLGDDEAAVVDVAASSSRSMGRKRFSGDLWPMMYMIGDCSMSEVMSEQGRLNFVFNLLIALLEPFPLGLPEFLVAQPIAQEFQFFGMVVEFLRKMYTPRPDPAPAVPIRSKVCQASGKPLNSSLLANCVR